MYTFKLKVKKDETLLYDGEGLVSNGHWLLPAGRVQLSDKSFQAFVDAGIKASRISGVIESKDPAAVPDMQKLLRETQSKPLENATAFPQLTIEVWFQGDATPVSPTLSDGGELVYFAVRYKACIEAADSFQVSGAESAAVLTFGEEKGLLMPVKTVPLAPLAGVLKALSATAEQEAASEA